MKITRSKGYNPEIAPAVTIRLQETVNGKKLDRLELIVLIRKLRRRYGITGGVEYEVTYQSADSTTSISS